MAKQKEKPEQIYIGNLANFRVYRKKNVYEAAIERIEWLFDEFPNIVVAFSGGKDSTAILNLTLEVARRRNRLPLSVLWLDQEAEWQATEDMVKEVMYSPEVKPYWYQIPFKMFNATSSIDPWLTAWGEGEKWMRPQDPVSIKVNRYGTDRFHKMFNAILKKDFPDQTALIGGVRAEESPARVLALTMQPTYKWVTWGKKLNAEIGQYTFYPVYDWSYLDVWKYIHDNSLPYNKLYDHQYQNGETLPNMRCSNLHHETAVHALFYLQEVEPETYEKLTQRLGGIDMAGKMGTHDYFVRKLPYMFKDWVEYRDFLLEKLIEDEKIKAMFRHEFIKMDIMLEGWDKNFAKTAVQSILTNDWELVKLHAMYKQPQARHYLRANKHKWEEWKANEKRSSDFKRAMDSDRKGSGE